VGFGWQQFSRDLLEELPQKVPADAVDAAMGRFRFSDEPGEYYSERQGWRARLFGGG
jgi:hypothetical protein